MTPAQVIEAEPPILTRMVPDSVNYTPIGVQELQASLLDTKSATIVTLSAITVPSYRKTGCPFKNNIQKFARVNGVLNWIYEDAVNRQRGREGNEPSFEALPRAWGTQLGKTCFISHVTKKGEHKLYLKFKVQNVLSIAYFTLDGFAIPESEIEPFLDEKNEGLRQGVLKTVVERDYTVSNLVAIHFNKMGYIVR